jgi:hypothetical protein
VLKFNSLKVAFEFADLSAVGIHRVLDVVPLLVDLFDDDLGIAKSQYSLDAKGHCYAESVNQSFVLYSIVGGLLVYLQDILELFLLRRDE